MKIGRKVIFSVEPLYGNTAIQALQELLNAFFDEVERGWISSKGITGRLLIEKGYTNELNLKFVVKPL